jgi:hypothetical protein
MRVSSASVQALWVPSAASQSRAVSSAASSRRRYREEARAGMEARAVGGEQLNLALRNDIVQGRVRASEKSFYFTVR